MGNNSNIHFHGASMLLTYQQYYVFGVKRIIEDELSKKLLLTGIGGKVEKGETYLQCIYRECLEEIGCQPNVEKANRTLIVNENGYILYENEVPDYPLIIVNRKAPGSCNPLTIHVFKATVSQRPIIIDNEFEYLLLLNEKCMEALMQQELTLSEALNLGADIISSQEYHKYLSYYISFTDSPEKYIKYWFKIKNILDNKEK